MRKAAWILMIPMVGCSAPMALTDRAKAIRVVTLTKQSAPQVYAVKENCRRVGEKDGDDRNQILNEAGVAGADTVVLEKGAPFRPDWSGEFYQCPIAP